MLVECETSAVHSLRATGIDNIHFELGQMIEMKLCDFL